MRGLYENFVPIEGCSYAYSWAWGSAVSQPSVPRPILQVILKRSLIKFTQNI